MNWWLSTRLKANHKCDMKHWCIAKKFGRHLANVTEFGIKETYLDPESRWRAPEIQLECNHMESIKINRSYNMTMIHDPNYILIIHIKLYHIFTLRSWTVIIPLLSSHAKTLNTLWTKFDFYSVQENVIQIIQSSIHFQRIIQS